jgi:glutamine phosphoribosylpyrophosphate amidotransferase
MIVKCKKLWACEVFAPQAHACMTETVYGSRKNSRLDKEKIYRVAR